MNSLEFIEAKIKSTERRIQELRKDQSFAITHNREDEFLDLDSDIEYYEDLLNHLQQVKSELEAWGVVKPYVDIIDKYTPYPTWQLKPNYDECKLKETNILIKALEVENE